MTTTEEEKEKAVKLKIRRVLGAATIFRQGGSLRVILPKKAFSFLNMPREPDDTELSTVILIGTDKGILVRLLPDFVKDEEMNKKV